MSKPIAALFKKNEAFGASLRPGFYELPDGEYELVEKATCDELAEALAEAVNALEVCGKDYRATEQARAALARYRGE